MTALTNPLETSAPLPDDMPIAWTNPAHLRAELIRAQSELMWALHKHRHAWAKMQAVKAKLNRTTDYLDNERPWKLAVGDVQWWRGEVNARSNSVLALVRLAEVLGVHIAGPDREVTGYADMAAGRRSFLPTDPAPRSPRFPIPDRD